jgi:hypothetical protein
LAYAPVVGGHWTAMLVGRNHVGEET